jgi:transketolase
VAATKRVYGWPEDATFLVPERAKRHMSEAVERGREFEATWNEALAAYAAAHPEAAGQFRRALAHDLPDGWDADLPGFDAGASSPATRKASGEVLRAIAQRVPWLIGGSADLAGSNKTDLPFSGDFEAATPENRNLHFGIREHVMCGAASGMALHGGVRPYVATFLVFTDYARPSIRLAALMEQPVIYVMTHDSIGLGEDGPTHQPIEQVASLRAMPGLTVVRPADANETSEAWRVAMRNASGPTALVLTRQKLPVLGSVEESVAGADGLARGAYVLADNGGGAAVDIILLASGSEVHVALIAWQRLVASDVKARVVSMPSWEIFEEQDQDYRETVLPRAVRRRLAIEAAASFGWHRYVGADGDVIAIDRYGASAPGPTNMEKFGFTADNVEERARALLAN